MACNVPSLGVDNIKNHGVHSNKSYNSKSLHFHKNKDVNTNTEVTNVLTIAVNNVDHDEEEIKIAITSSV